MICRLAAMKNPFSLSLNPFSILSPLFFDIPNRDDPKIFQIQSASGAILFFGMGTKTPISSVCKTVGLQPAGFLLNRKNSLKNLWS
jgi:hypothetical protein